MNKKLPLLFLGLVMCFAAAAQQIITGKVTSAENGEPVPGVTVTVKGSATGTQTDEEGNYEIAAEEGQVLVFSFLGMETVELAVGSSNTLDVSLTSDAESLDQVVVIGYGTQTKANLTGAVTTVDVEKTVGSRPVTDLGRALQGAAPGLTVTTPSGEPGSNPNIRLRGMTGSLNAGAAGAKPLILVDNVEIPSLQMINPMDIESISVLKDAASTSIYGTRAAWGVILITTKTGKKGTPPRISYSNNLSWSTPTITPQVSGAADWAETVISAARRKTQNPDFNDFGVLGMTVDQEAIQKMREWEQQYGGQDLGDEMVMGRDFEMKNGKLYFYRSWDAGEKYMRDWTPQQNHNLSVSGGSEKTNYYLGLGFMGQEGVLKVNPDNFNRYNVSLSVNSEVQPWLDVRGKLMLSNSVYKTPFIYSGDQYGPWYYLWRWPAMYPYGTYEGQPFRSAVTETQQANLDETKSTLSRIQVGATIHALEGLDIMFDYTYTNTNTHLHQAGAPVSGIDFWGGSLEYRENFASASYDYVRYNSDWHEINTGRAYATFQKGINDHEFKLTGGTDVELYKSWGQYSRRMQLLDPNKGELELAIGDQFADGARNQWATLGFFGRVNYTFRNKFLLELNGRYDGSSRFPTDDQWAFFPSLSAGYILTEEPFMSSLRPGLSFLKLRGSWGSVGNQNVGANAFLSTLGATSSGWLIGGENTPTVNTPGAVSPTLTWETVSTLDFGLDARFLNDQLGLTFDWYQRTTSDMLSSGVTLPSSFGTSAPRRNFGELETTGWELAIDWGHTFKNGLSFNVTGYLSDFKEKITKYANTIKTLPNPISEYNRISGSFYEGMTLGEIWGFETDRLFTEADFEGYDDVNDVWIPASGVPDQSDLIPSSYPWFSFGPGDVKYKDLNGDGVVDNGDKTVDSHGDMRVIGNSTPRWQYGFRIGTAWKGFDLDLFVQGVGKRDFWASGPIFIPGYRYQEAWYAHQMDYWTPDNPDAFYPTPSDLQQSNEATNFHPQTRYMMDMSYLRMKNITLGYTLPQRISSKANIQQLRVFVSGENLFEFDNLDVPLDPEVDFTQSHVERDRTSFGRVYPYRRTLSFGLQLTL